MAAIMDITERKRAEDRLRAYADRLTTLWEVEQAILAARSPGEIAGAALARVRRLLGRPRASITVVDWETEEGVVLATDTERETAISPGVRVPLSVLPDLDGLRRGETRFTPDIAEYPESPVVRAVLAEGIRSVLQVPLLAEGELIGLLTLSSYVPGDVVPAEQVEIVREVADLIAVALQQARLREEIERHAAELEERVAQRTADLAEANAELEAFAYTVAHDLRAPLRAMAGFGQALVEDYGDRLDDEGRDWTERITGAATSMDALIQDLLAYSRLSRADLELRPAALDSVVSDALAQLHGEVEARGAEVAVGRPLLGVLAHRQTLVQVVANLLGNALKFVPAATRPEVRVRAEEAGGRVRLWVEDNGIGIDPEHHQQIFRVFERLHGSESYPGTGIGLAIVRKGMERMGGSAGVESAVGVGSRFWIELRSAGGSE